MKRAIEPPRAGLREKDEGDLAALAALNEPMRRRLYRYVVGQGAAVNRDDAAAALGVARSVAAFHLDKLADLGLLEVEYRRPHGRSGPGAGRPAKMYRRAAGEIALSVPERHYDLAAQLLARAVEDATARSVPVSDALGSVARAYGRAIGAGLRSSKGRSRRALVVALAELLSDQGYEPRVEGAAVTLGNCPFHILAAEHRDLVCGMNLALLQGVVACGGLPDDAARLDPAPGRCCVSLLV
jgi:predicted ArsR family transcriptional regulator